MKSYDKQSISRFLPHFFVLLCLFCTITANAGEREDYTFAYKLYEKKAYAVAKDQFEIFIQKYPESKNVDEARMLVGESALNLEQ